MKLKDLVKVVDSDTLIILYVNSNYKTPLRVGYIRGLYDIIKVYESYEIIQISVESLPIYYDEALVVVLRG